VPFGWKVFEANPVFIFSITSDGMVIDVNDYRAIFSLFPMSEQRRVSYADIAKRVGYHRSTVGLALRNHPGIPEKTKDKIRKVAEQMGYRPDPMLSSVGRYQRRGSTEKNFNTIALLFDDPIDSDWRHSRHTCRDYIIGAKERAEELGFHTDEFSVGLNREYEKRVDQVLRSRGIQSIIVCPLRNQVLPLNINWENYSAVALGYSLPAPNLIRITSQHRTGAADVVKGLYGAGYRRLGLALCQVHDQRVDCGWSAGFYSACMDPALKGLEYATFMPPGEEALTTNRLMDWIQTSQVDAIIVAQVNLCERLEEAGFKIPNKLGIAYLDRPPERLDLAGIDQLAIDIGRQAVDQVAGLYAHYQRGLPGNRLIITVKGKWVSGSSIHK